MADRDRIDLEDLGARAKRHEPLAFAQIFDHFFERLRRYAYYQTGDIDRAEDIAADVIKTALEKIDSFDDRGGMLGAWLYGIARNLVARYFAEQGRSREVRFDDAGQLRSGDRTEESVLAGLSHQELYEAVSRLPSEQREVIILRYVEGYRSKEVALIMGKKPGAVRGVQHRAILSLKRTLGEAGRAVAGGAGGPKGPGGAAGTGPGGLESTDAG